MKQYIRKLLANMITIILVLSLVGCSASNDKPLGNNSDTGNIVTDQNTSGGEDSQQGASEGANKGDKATDGKKADTENLGSTDAENADSTTAKNQGSTDKEVTGGFQVDGTKLLDANGNEFVLRGVNHAHTWYRDQDGVALAAIAQTGSNSIRIVFSNGIQWTKDRMDSIQRLIRLCKDLNLIVIAEVHDGTGDDSIETLESIAQYWIEVKDALIGNEAYVILNIANEWVGSWKSEIWRDGYTKVIPELRAAGIKNTIMVDAAGWGQYGKSIADYGQEVFDSDPDGNTMFSIHMYGSAGKNETTIRENLEGVTSRNLCVSVGEFGYKHSDGDVDEEYLMKYCTENNIGYLGWSWKGNGGGVEYLDIASEWNGSVLTPEWGEILINGVNGIKETSKICSVFE